MFSSRWLTQTRCASCAGCSGGLLLFFRRRHQPSAEQTTACQDQAGQSGTGDGTGRMRWRVLRGKAADLCRWIYRLVQGCDAQLAHSAALANGESEQLSIAAGRSPPSAIGQSLHDRRHNRRIHRTADAQTRPSRKHDLNDARWHRLSRDGCMVRRDLDSQRGILRRAMKLLAPAK